MKASEAKKLIGNKIKWIDYWDSRRGTGIPREAKLLDVKGKNVYLDFGGNYDWLWLPDMRFVERVD